MVDAFDCFPVVFSKIDRYSSQLIVCKNDVTAVDIPVAIKRPANVFVNTDLPDPDSPTIAIDSFS